MDQNDITHKLTAIPPIMKPLSLLFFALLLITACHKKDVFDASGAFEAEETVVSAEANGILLSFSIEEGQTLRKGQKIGYVDTLQLYLKKKQLESQIRSTLSQKPNIPVQIATLQSQVKTAEREKQRMENLVKADAATTKQLDDISAQVDLLKKQLQAQQSVLGNTSESITQQTLPLQVQIKQIEDQITRARIINPLNGTVLTKYARENELVNTGKPLYKIADLSTLILRAYVSGNQLSQIKINQKVKVLVDSGKDNYKTQEGTITWISDKAEFTPKTIQTKDERANLVYAVKIKVSNDGSLKIGMYGEVQFQ